MLLADDLVERLRAQRVGERGNGLGLAKKVCAQGSQKSGTYHVFPRTVECTKKKVVRP